MTSSPRLEQMKRVQLFEIQLNMFSFFSKIVNLQFILTFTSKSRICFYSNSLVFYRFE